MFLQVMDSDEREKFLELVYKIANIDGEYAEEEQEIISSYMNELCLTEVKETGDIDDLIEYFADKPMELKKIVLFEVIGLINADDQVAKEEDEILNKMTVLFHLEPQIIVEIKAVSKRLQDIYDDIYSVLFD